MPNRKRGDLPNYCRSRGSAVVYVRGRRIHLGKYGSEESRRKYARVLAEHAAGPGPATNSDEMTVVEVIAAFWKHAESYYVESRSELILIRTTMRPLNELYGETLAKEFGPLALKAVRSRYIDAGNCRTFINKRVCLIRRMFKWAASEELIASSVYHDLCTVEGLKAGRTEAPESDPIDSVPEDILQQTLPELPEVVCDMVRLQRLIGSRPDEICMLRPADVDREREVWLYRPPTHKTKHHGRELVKRIGPQAQAILRPYLLRAADAYCFSPAESERKRLEQLHAERKTPLSCGNRPGTNRKSKPKRTKGDRYTVPSYRRAIHRACDASFPPPEPFARREGETKKAWLARLTESERVQLKTWQSEHRWSPNQLRHLRGTEVRVGYGLEGAQVVLGHANAKVTQVYAERDAALADRIAREIG